MCWNETKLVILRLQKWRLQGGEILSYNYDTIDVRDHRRKLQKASNLKKKKRKDLKHSRSPFCSSSSVLCVKKKKKR